MIIQTIGFTKKTAQQFFDTITANKSDLLLDVRLNNKSQLAGFTKGEDLVYFLRQICHCDYVSELNLAPTKAILDDYRDKKILWSEYEIRYKDMIMERGVCKNFTERFAVYERVVLLCSEPTPDKCHRRLAAEMIRDTNPRIEIIHL